MKSENLTTSHQQKLELNWTALAFFGSIHLLALLGFWFISPLAVGVTLFMHWLFGSIGICLGYHRLLSHRSFRVPKWLEYIITTIGALALQGGPIFWVAGHRLHHAFTEDEIKDPYSARKGFWWSHMLWLIYPQSQFFDYNQYKKYASDLASDPYYCWLNRNFLLLQIPLAIGLYLLGGFSCLIWGMFVRSVILWHSTWLINSATHMWGYRSFTTEDNSCNLWWAAILTYGEGWHNNHHAHPNIARAGWNWWEIDITWWSIWLLSKLGLAQKVTLPPLKD